MPMPMSIDVHVSGDLMDTRLRGGERHGLELARALRACGHRVRLFCRGPVPESELHQLEGLPVVRLAHPSTLPLLWRLGQLGSVVGYARELRRHRPLADAVLALSPWSALAARLVARKNPIVYVVTDLLCASQAFEEGRPFEFPNGSWRGMGLDAWLEQQAYRTSGRSVLPAEWMRRGLISGGVPEKRLVVIPAGASATPSNAHDRESARQQLRLAADSFIVLFVGAATTRKNPAVLVEALAHLPAHVHAAFAGDGPELDRLRQQAIRLGVAERAHFLGWLPDPAVAYAAADVVCHPALYESYGLVYIEAMLHRLPVLGPTHRPTQVYGSAPELIADGVDGLLFDACDARDLARQLQSLAEDPARTKQMGERGHQKASGFSWVGYAKSVERLLHDLGARQHHS
jgi:glycosyltransferase involved in cell wall biosynthesis